MTKNVIFDLGAVLIQWDAALAFADNFDTRDQAEEWMRQIDFDGWNRLQDGGRRFAEGLDVARARHGALADPLEGYLAAFHLTIEKPVPGSWEIVEGLREQGVPLYAITNWAAETWPAAIDTYPRLTEVFRDIVVSGQVSMLKPQPEIYRLLLDRNGLSASDCIFIDDSRANVEGALALGIDAIHFTDAEALGSVLSQRGLWA
ncbi:HAD family hydrolase [Paracoccus laeviglucosivorans]|uniref:2-haloacid dehalogenase n=1 Tax=Paracoccus laeviglucosivorans TaxID=1197861 RepID=A0A521FR19_9RHOB|nr:HAD family phosphatase [Paracoccus laeviglucosivorans]SMO98649.1 2-haloacid dehalogenase [Paracoccus laeviglucosivorans]